MTTNFLKNAKLSLSSICRSFFPKKKTNSIHEFSTFMKNNGCSYVVLTPKMFINVYSSDTGNIEHCVVARTMTKEGFVFTFKKQVDLRSSYSWNAINGKGLKEKTLLALKSFRVEITKTLPKSTIIDVQNSF